MIKQAKKALRSIGFTEEEVRIYLAGLELGEVSVQNLAKKAGIKRPTAYKILDALVAKGVFYQSLKGKKRYFNAEDPEKLLGVLKQKEIEFKSIMPELKSIFNSLENKPSVKFYEGLSGALTVYEDTINSAKEGSEILTYTTIEKIFEIFPKEYTKEYFRKRMNKKITAKVIAMESTESLEWLKNAHKEMREICLVKENKFPFFGDTEIFGDKVAFISYKENFMAVVIESREIANMQRFIFDMAWKYLKKEDGSQKATEEDIYY